MPPNCAKPNKLLLAAPNGIVGPDCDQSVVKGPVVKGTQGQAVLEFIRSAFMFNGDDVGSIQKIELQVTNAATVAVSPEHVRAETSVTELSVHRLKYFSALSGFDVHEVKFGSVFVRKAVQNLRFYYGRSRLVQIRCGPNVRNEEVGTESDRDLVHPQAWINPSLGSRIKTPISAKSMALAKLRPC